MRIIDGDGHVSERNISWADVLEEPYRSRAPKTVQDSRGVNFTMIDDELKFVAVAAPPTSASKKNLDDPDLYPFFAEAERLNVPVCIHVGAGDGVPAGTERFDHPFYTHAMAHPFEQMIAVLCIVVGGLLERFPRLKVAFMEAGAGWVPYWMERLDEHYEYLQPTVPWLTKPPSEYMRGGQLYYAFEMEEKTLPYVA